MDNNLTSTDIDTNNYCGHCIHYQGYTDGSFAYAACLLGRYLEVRTNCSMYHKASVSNTIIKISGDKEYEQRIGEIIKSNNVQKSKISHSKKL